MTNDRRKPDGEPDAERRSQQNRELSVISEADVDRWRRIEEQAQLRRSREYREDRAKFWWAVAAGLVVGLGNNLPEWIGRLWRIIGEHVR
jgi:hypothetical protein